jgi:hypothetical protein
MQYLGLYLGGLLSSPLGRPLPTTPSPSAIERPVPNKPPSGSFEAEYLCTNAAESRQPGRLACVRLSFYSRLRGFEVARLSHLRPTAEAKIISSHFDLPENSLPKLSPAI